MLKFVSLTFLLVFFSASFSQNGWTKPKKSFYAQAALSTFNSKFYYASDGDLINSGAEFHSHGLLLYGEYGITDQLNAVLDLPLLMLNHYTTTEVVAGVGNIKAGLKYRFFKNFPLSLQVDISIPTDDGVNLSTSKNQNVFGTYDQINLPTSDGEVNFWTTLAASQSTSNGFFGSIYGAANFRTKGFSHQFQTGFELGQLFFQKFYLIAKFKIQGTLVDQMNSDVSFLYGEGTTFSQYNLTGIYKINDHWNVLGGFSDMIAFPIKRRNLYDGFNIFAGISVEY